MFEQPVLVALLAAGSIALASAIVVLIRQRREAAAKPRESMFAASTEGEKVCPKCGMGNLWSEVTCSSCGTKLA